MIKFKYNIGDNIRDEFRDLTIINREIRMDGSKRKRKYYNYRCGNCSWDKGWVIENNINKGRKSPHICSCCSGYTLATGINDVFTTNPELLKYFSDINDAKLITSGSTKRLPFKCPNCNFEKTYEMSQLKHYGFSCPNCNDGVSYGEKYVSELFNQLKIKYKHQLTSKDFKWCGSYRYDFYFDNTIVEVMGLQHYLKTRSTKSFFRDYSKEHENDIQKKSLAMDNGVKYIEINASKSSSLYLKNSILNSELVHILHFKNEDIDWNKCDMAGTSSIKYEVCMYANEHNDLSIMEIANNLNRKYSFVYSCIRNEIENNTFGFDLRCIYNNGLKTQTKATSDNMSRPIYCIETGNVYRNAAICEEYMSTPAIKYNRGNISVSLKSGKPYKKHHFSYISKEKFNYTKSILPDKSFGDFFYLDETKRITLNK